jgi:hypothetical protein
MKLIFTFQGQEFRYPFPSSPSTGGIRQSVSNLRRVMGVRPVPRKKSPAAKPRKRAPRRGPECPTITGGGDPFATLAAIQGLVEAAEIEAGLDVPALGELHAKCEPAPVSKPSLWQRLWDGMRRGRG